jgi:hypothetical protein
MGGLRRVLRFGFRAIRLFGVDAFRTASFELPQAWSQQRENAHALQAVEDEAPNRVERGRP